MVRSLTTSDTRTLYILFSIHLIALFRGQVAFRLVKPCLLHNDHKLIEVDFLAAIELVWTWVADFEHQFQSIIATVKADVISNCLHVIETNGATVIVIIHLEGILEQLSHVPFVPLGYEPRHQNPELLLINRAAPILVRLVHQRLDLVGILRVLLEPKSAQGVLKLLSVDMARSIFIKEHERLVNFFHLVGCQADNLVLLSLDGQLVLLSLRVILALHDLVALLRNIPPMRIPMIIRPIFGCFSTVTCNAVPVAVAT